MLNFPLFELFLALREPLSLQSDQYTLLLEAMEKGYGIEGIEDIKEVCRLIWLKSRDTWQEQRFEQVFADYQKILIHSSPSINPPSKGETTPKTKDFKSDKEQEGTKLVNPSKITVEIPKKTVSTSKTFSNPSHNNFRLPGAYQSTPPSESTQSNSGFIVKMRDFPFLERQMRHNWDKLRRPLRIGRATEIDMAKTIQLASYQINIPFEPVRQPPRLNQTELLLLIDCDGSMIPFRPIIEGLMNTIEPQRFARVNRYYFRNVPRDLVYLREKGADIEYIENLPLNSSSTILLMISDGGAARGGYNPQRVDMTETFLNQIQSRVNTLIWLNPVPQERWFNTTAEKIANLIEGKMFELPNNGIQVALKCC